MSNEESSGCEGAVTVTFDAHVHQRPSGQSTTPMAAASFSAADAHMDALGIDAFSRWLWIPPPCFDAATVLVGEVAIAFIRARAELVGGS